MSRIEVHHLFTPASIPVKRYAKRFASSPHYADWISWINENGYTRLYRVVLTIGPGDANVVEYDSPGYVFQVLERFGESPTEVRRPKWTGGWHEMLLRYGSRTEGPKATSQDGTSCE
jgi:hypothetical protein